MDYNTQRCKIIMPEYGRNIQKMVDHAKTIKDRDLRNKAAHTIVNVMSSQFSNVRDVNDPTHKLWDHLAIISNFELDIDYPYEVVTKEKLFEKPRRLEYPSGNIRYKHYGKIIEKLVDKAINIPEGEEKEMLIRAIANQMKKNYVAWNKESISDELIFKELEVLSKGRLKITPDLKLCDVKEILALNQKSKPNQAKSGPEKPSKNKSGHGKKRKSKK